MPTLRREYILLGLLLLSVMGNSGLYADEVVQAPTADELRADGFQLLFDGTTLEAWNVEAGHNGHWTVRDGLIDYDGQAEQPKHIDKSLWTRKDFGDAVLRVDWRFPDKPTIKPHPIVLWNGDFLLDEKGKRVTRPHLDAGDSGILFRGTLKCQANIWCQELGSGEINGYRTDKQLPQTLRRSCIPFACADKPLGEWNTFVITLKEARMDIDLNGTTVLKSEPLPDLPAHGPIGLQHHGDRIQFRNIWIRELK